MEACSRLLLGLASGTNAAHTFELEIPDIRVPHALDQVLLQPACCGHQNINHTVLHQVPEKVVTYTPRQPATMND